MDSPFVHRDRSARPSGKVYSLRFTEAERGRLEAAVNEKNHRDGHRWYGATLASFIKAAALAAADLELSKAKPGISAGTTAALEDGTTALQRGRTARGREGRVVPPARAVLPRSSGRNGKTTRSRGTTARGKAARS